MINRQLEPSLLKVAAQLPVVAVLGPRQSGKTTLVKATFSEHRYISLENPDQRRFALEDPKGFLENYKNPAGIILDEFQNVPEILSYIQEIVDREQKPGYFILTGSQNFLLLEKITQTLAGRIGLLTLLPLSINELRCDNLLPESIYTLIFKGEYPRLYAYSIDIEMWYKDYITTYIERDVRQIVNITDLTLFRNFLELCAGRIGQVLNITSLANDTGITTKTAQSWLSLLQASYIIYTLQPYYKNFSKRIIKSPKLYFYDTGLACSLLNIESDQQLMSHYLKGGLVESLLITELIKSYYNCNKRPRVYFWRDSHGNELDILIERADNLIPVEIKAGKTINSDFFKGISYWDKLFPDRSNKGYIIYTGDENQTRSKAQVLSWKNIYSIFEK